MAARGARAAGSCACAQAAHDAARARRAEADGDRRHQQPAAGDADVARGDVVGHQDGAPVVAELERRRHDAQGEVVCSNQGVGGDVERDVLWGGWAGGAAAVCGRRGERIGRGVPLEELRLGSKQACRRRRAEGRAAALGDSQCPGSAPPSSGRRRGRQSLAGSSRGWAVAGVSARRERSERRRRVRTLVCKAADVRALARGSDGCSARPPARAPSHFHTLASVCVRLNVVVSLSCACQRMGGWGG